MTPAAANASAPAANEDRGPLGIVCGAGDFPLAVADAVTKTGRPVVLVGFHGYANPAIERYPHEWTHFGAFGKLVALLRKHNARDVVAVGSVYRPRLRDFRLDWTTLRIMPRLARLYRGGDDHLLSGVAELLRDYGPPPVSGGEIPPAPTMPGGGFGPPPPRAGGEVDI